MGMPRSATRQKILDAAYVQFRRKGFTRVSLDEIAVGAKVTKRTLYHHFESKDALLAAVLERQHELEILTWDGFTNEFARQPRLMITKMFDDLTKWSSRPRWAGSGFSRLAMELADLPGHPARIIAKRHKAAVEARFAEMLAVGNVSSPKLRAREIWLIAEGAMNCILFHGDPSYAETAKGIALQVIGHPVAGLRPHGVKKKKFKA